MIFKSASLAVLLAASTATAERAHSSYKSDREFRDTILSVTNRYRSEHQADNLSWNDTLASTALRWAKHCKWGPSGYGPGENLARDFPNVSDAVEAWGNERDGYDFNKQPDSATSKAGNFTQLVWKDTTTVGCARIHCGYRGGRPGHDDDDRDDWDDHDDRDDDRDDNNDDRDDKDDGRDDNDDDRDDDHDDRDDRDDEGENRRFKRQDDHDDDHDDHDDGRDDHDDGRDDHDDDRDDHDDDGHRGHPDSRDAYGWFVVCEYWPPGNVAGKSQFEANVQPLGRNESDKSGGNKDGGSQDSPSGVSEGDDGAHNAAIQLSGFKGWGVAITLLAASMGMFA